MGCAPLKIYVVFVTVLEMPAHDRTGCSLTRLSTSVLEALLVALSKKLAAVYDDFISRDPYEPPFNGRELKYRVLFC